MSPYLPSISVPLSPPPYRPPYLPPISHENRQGESLYRVRIVDTRIYPRLHADD